MDNAAIAAEAMSREDYLRKIIGENREDAMRFGGYASKMNRETSVDPLAMLRGGSNYTQQGYGERAAMFGMPQESVTRINPDAGVNIGLQQNANQANYLANTYAAREQAASGMAQGIFGGIRSNRRRILSWEGELNGYTQDRRYSTGRAGEDGFLSFQNSRGRHRPRRIKHSVRL